MNSETFNYNSSGSRDPQKRSFLLSPKNVIIIYTTLRILILMKRTLGLEAMLEYLGSYIGIVERQNPFVKHAVSRAVSLISVEKIYKEAVDAQKD